MDGTIEKLSVAAGSKQKWKLIMTHVSLRLYQSALFVHPKDKFAILGGIDGNNQVAFNSGLIFDTRLKRLKQLPMDRNELKFVSVSQTWYIG